MKVDLSKSSMISCRDLFHQLAVLLVAKKLLMDYRFASKIINGNEPEKYAEMWINEFIVGDQEFKDEISSLFIKLLMRR